MSGEFLLKICNIFLVFLIQHVISCKPSKMITLLKTICN